MRFRQFFEATVKNLAEIKDFIDQKNGRPFEELFEGRERFLVKVYNPTFSKAVKKLDYLNMEDFNFSKRTYKGKPVSPFIRKKKQELKDSIPSRSDAVAEYKNIYKDDLRLLIGKILVHKPVVEDWSGGKLSVKNLNRTDLGVFDPKHLEGISRENWTEKDAEIYLDAVLNGKEEGWLTWEPVKNEKVSSSGFYSRMAKEPTREIRVLGEIQQCFNQNNIFYYLLFTRHPIDVLRMSDHKDISSCHRLNGGSYEHCAISDAKNAGGVVYLIKGSDGKTVASHLEDREVFKDKDRDIGGIQPIGRTRIRCFVDTKINKDFGVLARFTQEQHYGVFTKEIWEVAQNYLRKHQAIFEDKPDPDYACENIVMAGGTYTDNASPAGLMNEFFKTKNYSNCIGFRDGYDEDEYGEVNDYEEEMNAIVRRYDNIFNRDGAVVSYDIGENIVVNIQYTRRIGWDEISDRLKVVHGGYSFDVNIDRDKFSEFVTKHTDSIIGKFGDIIRSWNVDGLSLEIRDYNCAELVINFNDDFDDPYGADTQLRYVANREDLKKLHHYVDTEITKLLGEHVDEYIDNEAVEAK